MFNKTEKLMHFNIIKLKDYIVKNYIINKKQNKKIMKYILLHSNKSNIVRQIVKRKNNYSKITK